MKKIPTIDLNIFSAMSSKKVMGIKLPLDKRFSCLYQKYYVINCIDTYCKGANFKKLSLP